MKTFELVFIPSPVLSHLVSAVETAKILLDRDERLSVTVLIMKIRKDDNLDRFTQKISSDPNTSPRLRLIKLSSQVDRHESMTSKTSMFGLIDDQITNVREMVPALMKKPCVPNSQLAGLVLDVFCTKFIPVAQEFSIPAYVFFTSGAYTLGMYQYLLSLKFEQNQELTQYNNSEIELSVPCFPIPVPAKVLPAILVEGGFISDIFLDYFRRIFEAKGIMLNTFYELESYAIESLLSDVKTPKVYPVGPILNLNDGDESGASFNDSDVKKWLDDQPENSVVFLCFGTMGSFADAQVKEMAIALENCGNRFLWSLRKPGAKGTAELVTEYENFEQVLPEGFLERTKGTGKVIGWAPQLAVLSHPAVGGFVSHCGWNSILESVWLGVPTATLPLFAEQQLNAFQLVKIQGMAEMIRLDYNIDLEGEKQPEIVGSEEIEAGIRRLMAEEGASAVRQKVKETQNIARSALLEGGSSYNAQCLFVEDVIKNII